MYGICHHTRRTVGRAARPALHSDTSALQYVHEVHQTRDGASDSHNSSKSATATGVPPLSMLATRRSGAAT